ncbi:MAG TPA: Npt1/Npt2 family nucleotide transporter [Methylomirabilota bacterium]
MLRRLEHAFGFRPGELPRGVLLFTYLFLVLASFVVGKAVRDALFLDAFGALLLPYADIGIAGIVGVWVSIYLRVARRVGVRMLLVGSLVLFSLTCLAFWVLTVWMQAAWLTPVIYVWVGMFGVVAPAQVWTLANYLLTTRQAKRLFGFVGSGATAGWIVGGFITERAALRFGAESTLLGMAVALLAAAGVVMRLTALVPAEAAGPVAPAHDRSDGFGASVRLIAGSPYLRAIAAVILLSSFATAVAGWQFKALAARFFEGRDQLAAFFGAFNFYAGLLSFAMQWLLTGRLLRRLGLGFTLFVVPVSLTLGTAGLLLFGSLAAVIVLRGSDQVLRYAVDKPTVELLYLPISAEQTLAAKSFIDTVVWRLGDGLAGVTVLVFAALLQIGPVAIGWVNLVVLGGWLLAAWVARRQYVVQLQESIHHYRLDAERTGPAGLERTAAAMLARQLGGSDPAEILYALSLLGGGGRHHSHPAVRGLVTHPLPAIRAEAIRVLDESGDRGAVAIVERALYDPDLSVRTRALLYVAHHTHVDPLERIEQLGAFEDFSIRAAMVSFLAQPGQTENLEAARVLLEGMLNDEDPRTRLEAARLLELLPDRFEDHIRQVLETATPGQVRHAIRAVGRLGKRSLVVPVIARLGDAGLAPDAVEALATFGDPLVGTLREALLSPATPEGARRQIPAVLLRIGTEPAFRALGAALLDPDTHVRIALISALNKLRDLHPTWPLDERMVETVLGAEIMGHYRSYQILGTLGSRLDDPAPVTDALREAMERELERIFRLIKLRFPQQDLHSAYVGIQSTNRAVHDNALEFLEHVLTPELRRVLVPLIDSGVTVAQRVELANRLLGTAVSTSEEAIVVLLRSDDPWLQSCGAYAVGALGLSGLAPELDRLEATDDPLLRESVRQARLQLGRA